MEIKKRVENLVHGNYTPQNKNNINNNINYLNNLRVHPPQRNRSNSHQNNFRKRTRSTPQNLEFMPHSGMNPEYLNQPSLLSKDSPDHGGYQAHLPSQRSTSQNQRFPSENTINFNIREFNKANESINSRFPYVNPNSNGIQDFGNSHYQNPGNNHLFEMRQNYLQSQFKSPYYQNKYPSPYGTHQFNNYPRAHQNFQQNPYLSHKDGNQKIERPGYPIVPNNSATGRVYDPNQKRGFYYDIGNQNHERIFEKTKKSSRHYPKSREFKPSKQWRLKEKRLSRDRKPVDAELMNVINKYK